MAPPSKWLMKLPKFARLLLVIGIVIISFGGWLFPSLAQTNAWPSLANVTWGKGLPAFSYPFHQTPLTRYDGGTTKQVGTYNFPVSQGMAGVYMTLEPGAVRELHWHANAAEWAYVVSGRTRITLTSPDGSVEIADVDQGGLWYFPRGWGHSIEGLGPGTATFILVFNDGTFSEGATFSITDWVSHMPMTWVKESLGLTTGQVQGLPNKQVYISRRPPAPGPLAVTQPRNPNTRRMEVTHVHNLAAQPYFASEAKNTVLLASKKEFPASFNMAGGIIHLEPGAIRQPHWHPNADEWQYILDGEMELTVFASEGKASISKLKTGDVGYIPKGYGHALRNPTNKPMDVLLVFDAGEYESIELTGWIASNPDAVVGNTFQIPANLLEKLPQQKTLFAMPKR